MFRIHTDGEEFELFNYQAHVSSIIDYKGDVELYNIDIQTTDANLSPTEQSRLVRLIAKEKETLRARELNDSEKIQAFIELAERNPELGFDATKIKKAFYYLRGNDFSVPGMRDLS